MASYAFDNLDAADLVVDAVYLGGTVGNVADDPLDRLMRVGNQGGFRAIGRPLPEACKYAVLYTSGDEPDWPDRLDVQTGRLVYYGDNRTPGAELHDTRRRGNKLLAYAFEKVHGGQREDVPPFFVFERARRTGRAVRFRGLAVPGAEGFSADTDLVAIWRSKDGARFQNYKALFTVLNVDTIERSWLSALRNGQSPDNGAPDSWLRWVASGRYEALVAPSVRDIRTKEEQLPHLDSRDARILDTVYGHFAEDSYSFERFAMLVWQQFSPSSSMEQTRPVGDGGRDAIGALPLGPTTDPVRISFALEAKCYQRDNGVNVRETSRLISRLKHREFGVLVTTSYVGRQAYEEIKDDGHPVAIVSGADVAQAVVSMGYPDEVSLGQFLASDFPVA